MTLTRRSLLKTAAAGAAVAAALPAEARERKQRSPDHEGLLYDSTLCIGCRACVSKCKQANNLPSDVRMVDGVAYDAPEGLNSTTKTVIQQVSVGDGSAFIKRQCMHCLDPACVTACMIKAFQKEPNGAISYDQSRCLGDRYCQMACPFNVPKFEWSKALPVMVKCELCRVRSDRPDRNGVPACAEVCPRDAVISGKVTDLMAVARARQKAHPGRYEQRIYGEKEAGGTQCLYLAPAGVTFEELGLPKLDERPIPEMATSLQHRIYYGGIAPIVGFIGLGLLVSRNRARSGKGESK
jgi:Fe-S-cluster-containing dehydrogenase component